ncbi:hypothetical protein ACJIZ3_019398 [Penstemon smallii]|uniref:Cytochrome P450 n=1 Tax=Penstemon smallii TaxID=265156 RepID=A0ABD3T1S6_9LAMI
MITIFPVFVVLTILAFLSLFYKLWWSPIHLQKSLHSQGLKGPSYKFIHGSTKEIIKMRKEAISTSFDLSHHDLFPRIMPHINTWMKLYGNNFLIWIGHQPQVVVSDPELVKEILTNKEGVFQKIKPISYVKKLLGDGLVVAEGEKWSRLRKLANHAFHGESLKDMVPEMVASVETMLERWRYIEGEEIEVSKEFRILTSEVISRTAFGSSYLEGENIFEMLTKLAVLASRNAFKIRFPGLGEIWRSKDDIESEKIEKSLRNSIVSMIRKREYGVMKGEAQNFGSDFLGSLLKAHHNTDPKNRISVDDIIDEFYTDWQEKAREEVLQLIGKENPTVEAISRMKILTMVVNEALRLYSPVTAVTRKIQRKIKLGKYEIPANVDVNIPTLVLHRDPEIWGKDSHLFNPERFSEGLAKATNGNSMAFLPFGFGPRICVGLNFAANEAKIALSMMMQRYKFTLSPNYVHSPFLLLTLKPQHGIQIILQSL